MSRSWEADFVAFSIALDEPMAEIFEALGKEGVARVDWFLERIETGPKAARALALASALAEVVTNMEHMGLR